MATGSTCSRTMVRTKPNTGKKKEEEEEPELAKDEAVGGDKMQAEAVEAAFWRHCHENVKDRQYNHFFTRDDLEDAIDGLEGWYELEGSER